MEKHANHLWQIVDAGQGFDKFRVNRHRADFVEMTDEQVKARATEPGKAAVAASYLLGDFELKRCIEFADGAVAVHEYPQAEVTQDDWTAIRAGFKVMCEGLGLRFDYSAAKLNAMKFIRL